ncbi:MAG: PsiF family protein [Proteobacteria bacterium]|nr:PsiF family protein [Pseudomonadota bacterium]
MKKTIALLALAFACGSSAVLAADDAKKTPSPAQQAQQDRMKNCNAEAGEKSLKGDERKKFMSECLKGKPAATQQDKMKTCNAEAGGKGLKGDERKKFMSECLKGSGG